MLIDLSALRHVRSALCESERKFPKVAQHIDSALYIQGLDGTISYASPAYERIWGRSVEELYETADAWLDAVHPEDRDRVRCASEAMLAGKPFDEEYRIVRPGGDIPWIRDRASALTSERGGVDQIVGVAEDITERRRLETELHHAKKMEAVGTLGGFCSGGQRYSSKTMRSFGLLPETDPPRASEPRKPSSSSRTTRLRSKHCRNTSRSSAIAYAPSRAPSKRSTRRKRIRTSHWC